MNTSQIGVFNNLNQNQEVDLLDIYLYKKMIKSQRKEIYNKLIEKYGEEKGKSYSLALEYGSSFSDSNMQKAIFENLSGMSYFDGLDFLGDLQLAIRRYLQGQELKASYSIILDKKNKTTYFNNTIDVLSYFNDISLDQFKYILLTLKKSHDSLSNLVGTKQSSRYSEVYEKILNSYNKYKDIEENIGKDIE